MKPALIVDRRIRLELMVVAKSNKYTLFLFFYSLIILSSLMHTIFNHIWALKEEEEDKQLYIVRQTV